PSVFGQSVTLTANVSGSGGTPTGSVTFKDSSTTIGSGTLASGSASAPVSSFVTGQHTLTAVYNGDATFAASASSPLTQTVNKGTSATVVSSGANPSLPGQSVTFTATVSATSPASGTPTGTAIFKDGGVTLGNGTLVSGSATFSTSSLTVGTHSITAVYNGDGNFNSNTSAVLSQFVGVANTYVSGIGLDSGACPFASPCRTFSYALSVTSAGGEINCLSSSGYGGATITKSVAIVCDNVTASVVVSNTDAIDVNAGPADVVTLKGLDIEGVGSGVNGVSFTAGKSLTIINSVIRGFTGKGINFVPGTANASLFVQNTIVADNASGGILIAPTGGFTASARLTKTQMARNTYGLRVQDNGVASVFDGSATSNTNNGFIAVSASVPAEINLTNSVAANNGTNGIATSGRDAIVRIAYT